MPANKNATPGPSTTKQMAADIKAELAVMEAEEAAEEKRKQEWKEKKKKLAELTEGNCSSSRGGTESHSFHNEGREVASRRACRG